MPRFMSRVASRTSARLLAVGACACAVCAASGQAVSIERIVSSNEPAPVAPPGSTFFAGGATQSALGPSSLVFETGLLRPQAPFLVQVALNQGLFRKPAGQPVANILSCAEQVPGEPAGVVLAPLIRIAGVSDAGRVTFSGLTARIIDDITLQTLSFVLLVDNGSGPSVFAKQGEQAPGLPAGVRYTSFGSSIVLSTFNRQSASGDVAFLATLGGTGVTGDNDAALFVGTPGGVIAPRLREGDPGPGGVVYGTPSEPRIDPTGRVVVRSTLSGATTGGIVEFAGPTQRLVLTLGQAAPGLPGATIEALDEPATNVGGRTLVVARTGGAGTRDALYLDTGGTTQLVLATGDPAPGLPGVTIANLGFGEPPFPTAVIDEPQIAASGDVALVALLAGAGVNPGNNRALFAGRPGQLRLVARVGDQAPGVPAGVRYGSISTFAISDSGRVAWRADLTGGGAVDEAIYATTSDGQVATIVRTGDSLPFGPGQNKVARDISWDGGPGRASGFESRFDDTGRVPFSAEFTDFTSAQYLATVGGCYPNCDGSTGNPALTPADFVCFLNRFRAGDSYANCDGSTGNPALTPADFVCFLNRFRAGC